MQNRQIGSIAEDNAAAFLKSQNLQIIDRNYNALPYGEIDIIALDKEILIFIEVKFRKKTTFATAEETITTSKISKLTNTANIFLQRNPNYENHECRFDVIAINDTDINWIRDAF